MAYIPPVPPGRWMNMKNVPAAREEEIGIDKNKH
jgi:hypothetical protein